MIGAILGNYRILKKLGEGGMGTVYQARDLSLEREVAIKIISPELARNPRLMARFRVEAIAQAKLNHSNITVIHSFEKEKDTYFIVMEYVDGKTLNDVIKGNKTIPVGKALEIFSQVLKGITYAHSRDVVHRDIKPSNIFLTKDQKVKIGDFGIAKVKGIEGLTRVGSTLGSPLYCSPEQVMGKKTDARADVYSLGITLYEMATGKLPFKHSEDSNYKMIKDVMEVIPRKPSELDTTIPSAIDAVVMKSIAKSPGDRFQSVKEFEKAIKKLMLLLKTPASGKMEPIDEKVIEIISTDKKAIKVTVPSNRKRILVFAMALSIILVSVVILILYSTKSEPVPQAITTGLSDRSNRSATTHPAEEFPSIIQPEPEKPIVTKTPLMKRPPVTPEQPTQVRSSNGISEILGQMDWLINKGYYLKAVGVGEGAIKNGTVSAEIYLKLAKAYYYNGKKEGARKYYWETLGLGGLIRFNVNFQYKKNRKISGTLFITKSKLIFQPFQQDLNQLQFSIELSQIKRISVDLMSDISGIFKKKNKRKNPGLIIKGKQNQKYSIQLKSKDTKLRRFIMDIINTLRKALS